VASGHGDGEQVQSHQNLTSKHALTFDRSTTLLATKGALDPHTGAALFAGGCVISAIRARTFMVTSRPLY